MADDGADKEDRGDQERGKALELMDGALAAGEQDERCKDEDGREQTEQRRRPRPRLVYHGAPNRSASARERLCRPDHPSKLVGVMTDGPPRGHHRHRTPVTGDQAGDERAER
jgi:hypothetical protein